MRVLLFVFILTAIKAHSQNSSDSSFNKGKFKFSIGLNGQWFILDEYSPDYAAQGIINNIYTGDGGNSEGIGVVTEISYRLPKSKFLLTYSPVWRYDVVIPRKYFIRNINLPEPSNVCKIFVNHHFSISRIIFVTRKGSEKPKYIGVGYSFISPTLSYPFDWEISNAKNQTVLRGKKVDLSFNGYHFYIGIPLSQKFYLEPRLIIIPSGQIMFRAWLPATMISFSIKYQFAI